MTLPAARRVYRAETAFDGDRPRPRGALVLVEAGRIVGVEDADLPVPAGWDVTSRPGTTLLPGLIDAHVHLCGDGGPRALEQLPDLTDAELDEIVLRSLRTQLVAGVTAVRDLGDARWAVLERHRSHPDGPTVVASGPPVTTPGGHCWFMAGEAQGERALRDAVRERAERGADVVKVMTSGGLMTATTDATTCQYSLDDLRVLVEAAHGAGLPVTAHAHALAAVEQCLDAGVDGIEHGSCLTASGFVTPPQLAERLAASGVPVCPTLGRSPGVEPPPQVRAAMERTGTTWEGRLEQAGDLYQAGVQLVSGADSGISPNKPHGILPSAVLDLVEIGATPAEALASATGAAADVCGLAPRTGRLRAGLDADLLLVDGDATTDIQALTRVRAVVSRGRPVELP
jgi:imidazolonepropionase-like amidohydrolase